jgi:transposase
MDRDHRFLKTWKKARRKRAFELKQQGWKQKDIAEGFAVSPAAVSQWLATAQQEGVAAWRAKPRPTGPIKLTEAQLHVIPELLSHGAQTRPSSSNGTKNVKVCLLPLPQGPAYAHAARSGLSPCRSEASSMGK